MKPLTHFLTYCLVVFAVAVPAVSAQRSQKPAPTEVTYSVTETDAGDGQT